MWNYLSSEPQFPKIGISTLQSSHLTKYNISLVLGTQLILKTVIPPLFFPHFSQVNGWLMKWQFCMWKYSYLRSWNEHFLTETIQRQISHQEGLEHIWTVFHLWDSIKALIGCCHGSVAPSFLISECTHPIYFRGSDGASCLLSIWCGRHIPGVLQYIMSFNPSNTQQERDSKDVKEGSAI